VNDLYDAIDCVRRDSLWISGVLNNRLVLRLAYSRHAAVHPQWSRSLQNARVSVCRSRAFGRCFLFLIFFRKVPSPSFLQSVFEHSASILHEPYSLNWYKFLISVLSSLLNGMLHHQYFVTALKLLFTTISSAFIYKHHRHIQNDT